MFFILDEESSPDVVSQGELTYPVLNVIEADASVVSSEINSYTT